MQCYFLMFFRVLAFSIFCDFRCPEAPFWCQFWSYFESPGPLKKPSKLCNCHRFQRFGPFQIQSFCKSLLRVRFDSAFFRFLWFLAVLRLPFWDLLVLIVVKKEVWKKYEKNDQKRERNERNKNGTGRVGSLKTEENKTSEFKKTRHWIKHALACLKARWRIYIYIYIYTHAFWSEPTIFWCSMM